MSKEWNKVGNDQHKTGFSIFKTLASDMILSTAIINKYIKSMIPKPSMVAPKGSSTVASKMQIDATILANVCDGHCAHVYEKKSRWFAM